MTAALPAGPSLADGVLCPQCGCRRLLSERPRHTADCTVRVRRCSACGHRVLTAEWLDRPEGGHLRCPACGHHRLLVANLYHYLLRVIRLRRCPNCQTKHRTVERRILAPVTQSKDPAKFLARRFRPIETGVQRPGPIQSAHGQSPPAPVRRPRPRGRKPTRRC